MTPNTNENETCWFVGAVWGAGNDQFERFLREGIWEEGSDQKNGDLIRQMKPGDRIAIKSSFTQKNGLPFNNRSHSVSVMRIKAIGTIKANPRNGVRVEVEWKRLERPREWLFYTSRLTVWKVVAGKFMTDALIAFAFEEAPQDIQRFLSDPYWREKYGSAKDDFEWIPFYQEFADRLRPYANDRASLLQKVFQALAPWDSVNLMTDQYTDGTKGPVRDIDPFTVMAIFNRGNTDAKRTEIAAALADSLGVATPAPSSFKGIPVFNNQNSWLMRYEKLRAEDHLPKIWELFDVALRFAERPEEERESFLHAFDAATAIPNVKWNLTQGLFWMRPETFATLDAGSRAYIAGTLGLPVHAKGPNGVIAGEDYLDLLESLEERFRESESPVRSFPELSLKAWKPEPPEPLPPQPGPPFQTYDLEDVLAEGCFLEESVLRGILQRLRQKKNLILQGPPGTGKTWLAKRLAYSLMGEKATERLRAIQFHPNLSYEDFVRGWRPQSDGKLSLVDGPLLQIADLARANPDQEFALVIEEVNRGNPAQIFGEALTLLEADKRDPDEALGLSYTRFEGERVYLPPNLYVIGTMNIADRSLALVDLALRRRFAFVELEPAIGSVWKAWMGKVHGMTDADLNTIQARMADLNDTIANDPGLGRQFRIGHSYVTPSETPVNTMDWFLSVVETEIRPLLEEYWFDKHSVAQDGVKRLQEGL